MRRPRKFSRLTLSERAGLRRQIEQLSTLPDAAEMLQLAKEGKREIAVKRWLKRNGVETEIVYIRTYLRKFQNHNGSLKEDSRVTEYLASRVITD